MAGSSGGAAVWKITGEDRAKHDSQFFQLKPVNGFITGDQARGFFMQSGLPTPVLGQIWTLADMNNDGKMDKKEFSIAMHLIKKKLQGYELPKSLPASLKADPSPMMGSFGGMPTGSMSMGATPGMPVIGTMASTAMVASPMTMPVMSNGIQTGFGMMGVPVAVGDGKPRAGSFNATQMPVQHGQAGGLAIPHQSRLKYTQVFNTNDRNKRGFLTGVEARSLLMQSGLPQPMLAQVWTLSDVDKDGKLSCDEFCIAMHLIDIVRMGRTLPQTLPSELLPTGSFGSQPKAPPPQTGQQGDAFGDLLGTMGMPVNIPKPDVTNGESKQDTEDDASTVTFEDRRKENFAKGQAELERRRQMLQDQMKREQEARMEKERQEQEKRERIRQEQERKRQMELERQMEKQRQIEREREEQRQKMMEQREAARREMDRQRQMEWERQRKEQLLAEKRREYEQLGAIKSRSSDLKCELESQEGKRTEITQKISQVRNGVTDFTSSIEGMRTTRDTKISDIERLQNELQTLTMNFSEVQREREQLNVKMQTTVQNNPLSETHRTVLHSVELKKTSIQKLKKDLEQIERDTESKLLEIDNNNTEHNSLNKKLTDIQNELTSLQKQQQQKQTDALQSKRKQEEENQNKQKQEKDRQEKLRKDLESQRLKEQEKTKKEPEPAKTSDSQGWFNFDNKTTTNTTAQDDVWSSAFSAENLKTETNDIWSSAFSSQKTESPVVSSSVSAAGNTKYKALYQFDAKNLDELTLMPDDIVMVYENQSGAEPGWMKGEKNGKSGWFPKDYVEQVPDNQSSQQSAFSGATPDTFSVSTAGLDNVSESSQASKSEESPFSSIPRPTTTSPMPGQGTTAPDGLQAQALYPWKAKKENHLTFNKGDIILVKEQQDMWWSGELNGQVGWFPKSYVKLKGSATTSLGGSRSETPVLGSTDQMSDGSARSTPQLTADKDASGELYVAMYAYKSAEAGDLNFNQGDEIMVTKMEGDWWTGTLADKTGIFPATYVKKAEVQKSLGGVDLDPSTVGQRNTTPTQELTPFNSSAVLDTNIPNVPPANKDLNLNLSESPPTNNSLLAASQVKHEMTTDTTFHIRFDPFIDDSRPNTTVNSDSTETNISNDKNFDSFGDFGTFIDNCNNNSTENKFDFKGERENDKQGFKFDPFSDDSEFGVITDSIFPTNSKDQHSLDSSMTVCSSEKQSNFDPFKDHGEFGTITDAEYDSISQQKDTLDSNTVVSDKGFEISGISGSTPAVLSRPELNPGGLFDVTDDVFGDPFKDSDPFANETALNFAIAPDVQESKPRKQQHVTWASTLISELGPTEQEKIENDPSGISLSPLESLSEVMSSLQDIGPQGGGKQQSFNASTSTTDLSNLSTGTAQLNMFSDDDIYEEVEAPSSKIPVISTVEKVSTAMEEDGDPESVYEALDSEWVAKITEGKSDPVTSGGATSSATTLSSVDSMTMPVQSPDQEHCMNFRPPVPKSKRPFPKNTVKLEETNVPIQSVNEDDSIYESYEEVIDQKMFSRETNGLQTKLNPIINASSSDHVFEGSQSVVQADANKSIATKSKYTAVKANKSFFDNAFKEMQSAEEYSNVPAETENNPVKASKSFFEDAFKEMESAEEYSNVPVETAANYGNMPKGDEQLGKILDTTAVSSASHIQGSTNVFLGEWPSAISGNAADPQDRMKSLSGQEQPTIATPAEFYDDFEVGPSLDETTDQGWSAISTPTNTFDDFETGPLQQVNLKLDEQIPVEGYDDFEIGPEDKMPNTELSLEGSKPDALPSDSYDDFELGPEDKMPNIELALEASKPDALCSESYDDVELGPEDKMPNIELSMEGSKPDALPSDSYDDFELGPDEPLEYLEVLQDPVTVKEASPDDSYEEFHTKSSPHNTAASSKELTELDMLNPDVVFGASSFDDSVKKSRISQQGDGDDDSEYEEVCPRDSSNKTNIGTVKKSKKKKKIIKEKDKVKDPKKKETKDSRKGLTVKDSKSDKKESKQDKATKRVKENTKPSDLTATKEEKKKKNMKDGKETKKGGIISGMFSALRSQNKQQATLSTETSPVPEKENPDVPEQEDIGKEKPDGPEQEDTGKEQSGGPEKVDDFAEETEEEMFADIEGDMEEPVQKSASLKKPEIASVIAAYTATGQGQLSLQPGQLIQVRKKSASGWWEGELQARGQKRKIGWFPANYVKLLGSSSTRSTPDTGLQSQQRASPASMINRTNTPTMPPPQLNASSQPEKYTDQVVALFPYTAQNDDELTFHNGSVINVISKDDPNWWHGEVNGHTGMFPSNYVGPLTTSPPQEPTWSSDPSVLAKTSAQESKRQNHIHELINTENTYMEDMSIVLDAFYRPMSEAKVMTEEELSAIFVNWNELILCNTKLSKSLKVRKKMCGKGQVIQVIGDILCENLPHLTPYIRFCSCQLNAAAMIQHKTETSVEFKDVQKKCVQDPRTKGMPMSSFLLKPMQRITKYPLMIEKILHYTPEGHPDHQNLTDALSKAEELCSQVNEGVRERENCDRLEWLQNHVQCDGLPEKLTFNSVTNCLGPRKLLFSGTLYKTKSNKELVGFLFNDFLLLTQPLSSSTTVFVFDPKAKTQYKMYKTPIFLNEVMVKKSGDEESDPCQFQLSHVDRVYNLKATNQTEGATWVRNIEGASRHFLETERRKREKAHSSETKTQGVGRLLVIITEGINLAPTEDVRRTAGVGRLLVMILEGCDLQPSDINGKSDPFCEVSMGVQEHKTKVITATLNPKWNQSMQFVIRDVEQDVLCITVFDRDVFSPNDFLGRTEVRVKEILEENQKIKGPITKRLLLHEVSSGEILVKLNLQLYENT